MINKPTLAEAKEIYVVHTADLSDSETFTSWWELMGWYDGLKCRKHILGATKITPADNLALLVTDDELYEDWGYWRTGDHFYESPLSQEGNGRHG